MKRAALLALVALAACQRPAPGEPAPSPSASAAMAPAQASTPLPSAAPTPSASRDPAEVLAAWAQAITARDWATVRAYWGDAGGESGLDPGKFGEAWDALKAPRVAIGKGEQEGAAGSLYYTAPVTITDGARTIAGEVVLRRVNDVDGASAEQLRWHIESSSIAP